MESIKFITIARPTSSVQLQMYASYSPSLPAPASAHLKSPRPLLYSNDKHSATPFTTRPPTGSVTPFLAVSIADILIAALQALFCLMYIITGHAILRAAHHDGYAAPISSSAVAGALGGAIFTVPAILLCLCRRKGLIFVLWSIAVDTTIGALTGSVGVLILKSHIHGEILNPLHAARAGALGAVIFSITLHVLKAI
jgi:hypothetical protein